MMSRIHHISIAFLATLLGCSLLLFSGIGIAFAHAKVISATPAIGSTITTAPTTVTVQTAENINPDPKLTNLFVYSPAGDLISQGNAKVPLNNPKEMSIPIKPAGDGTYVVRWITVSADDGDPDQGAFIFTVKPASAATAPSRSTTTSAAQPASNSGIPVVPISIASVVALIIGLGIGLSLGSRSARSAMARTAAHNQAAEPEETSTPRAP